MLALKLLVPLALCGSAVAYLRYWWRMHPRRRDGTVREEGSVHDLVDVAYKWLPALTGFALAGFYLYGALLQ